MRWGVSKGGTVSGSRKTQSKYRGKENQKVQVKQAPGRFVKTSGGKRGTATKEAVQTAAVRQVAKKSTTDALTNKQLKDATARMQLEVSFSKLSKQVDRQSRGQKFIAALPGMSKKVEDLQNNPQVKATLEQLVAKAAANA